MLNDQRSGPVVATTNICYLAPIVQADSVQPRSSPGRIAAIGVSAKLAQPSASLTGAPVLAITSSAAQSIHILAIAIAIAMSALLMIHLRSLGVLARDQTRVEIADRFLPALWLALPTLLATGTVLIVAEPARSLRNPAFYWKMGLLLAGIVVTLAYARPLRRDPSWWDAIARRRQLATGIAIASLMLWVGIVFCGRWIAYVEPF